MMMTGAEHAVNSVKPLDTANQEQEHVNSRQALPLVNRLGESRRREAVNRLSSQQHCILTLAERPDGVSSHELVVILGGDRVRTRPRQFYWNGDPDPIVGTPASRSVAASVSRSLSRLCRAKLLEVRQHPSFRDSEQRLHSAQWRYHRR